MTDVIGTQSAGIARNGDWVVFRWYGTNRLLQETTADYPRSTRELPGTERRSGS
jgi:hypothetical protein